MVYDIIVHTRRGPKGKPTYKWIKMYIHNKGLNIMVQLLFNILEVLGCTTVLQEMERY